MVAAELKDIKNLIKQLTEDRSIPRNVRVALEELKDMFKNDAKKEQDVKIDTALQMVEDLALDPNLSSYARTQIWNLTSLLESVAK